MQSATSITKLTNRLCTDWKTVVVCPVRTIGNGPFTCSDFEKHALSVALCLSSKGRCTPRCWKSRLDGVCGTITPHGFHPREEPERVLVVEHVVPTTMATCCPTHKAELQTITPLKDVELQSTSMSFKPLPRLPCYTTPLRKPNKVPPCKCASVSLTAIGTDCKLLEFFEDGLFKGPCIASPRTAACKWHSSRKPRAVACGKVPYSLTSVHFLSTNTQMDVKCKIKWPEANQQPTDRANIIGSVFLVSQILTYTTPLN